MLKKIVIVTIIAIAALATSVSAADMTQTGQASGVFLKVAPDARFVGMGDAGAAASQGVSALYYNPAGLVNVQDYEAMFTHSEWLADVKFEYLAVSFPMSDMAQLALSFTYFGYPEMEVTTITEPDGTGATFSASDTAVGLTYARRLLKTVDFGITGKVVSMKIWDMTANAVAMDAGVKYHTPIKGLTAALSIANFGTKPKFEGGQLDKVLSYIEDASSGDAEDYEYTFGQYTEDHELPMALRVGFMYTPYVTDEMTTAIAVDFYNPVDNSEQLNLGGEFGYNVSEEFHVAARGGYRMATVADSIDATYSFGGGLQYMTTGLGIGVDYAYNGYDKLEETHLFTLKLRF